MTSLPGPYRYQNGYIWIDAPKVPGLPDELSLGGVRFFRHNQLHMSLVPINYLSNIIAKNKHLDLTSATRLVEKTAIEAIIDQRPSFDAYRNELRWSQHPKEDRGSLVVMAYVTNLINIYSIMSRVLHEPVPIIPAHVTLYTSPKSAETIGLRSPEELTSRSRTLTRKEVSDLEKHIDPYLSFRWSTFMTPAPVQNNLTLELHVPGFQLAKEFYAQFGFREVAYDPISGGGDSDLGYIELKREDSLGRTQINFYGDKDHVARHAYFNQFPSDTPRGYAVEITVPVDNVEALWLSVVSHLSKDIISQPLEVKRWGKLDFRVIDPYGFYVRFTEPVDWYQDA